MPEWVIRFAHSRQSLILDSTAAHLFSLRQMMDDMSPLYVARGMRDALLGSLTEVACDHKAWK